MSHLASFLALIAGFGETLSAYTLLTPVLCLAQVVWVPGSFEIPLIAKSMAKSGKFDAVLTIGAVVRI